MRRKWKRTCIRKNDNVISKLRAFVRINTFEALMKGRYYYPGDGLFYCIALSSFLIRNSQFLIGGNDYVVGYRKSG